MDQMQSYKENKVEKSVRNTTEFNAALKRAEKGDFDEDITSSKEMNLLKVTERFSIHEIFSLEEGKPLYKLMKEVFYINNPGKRYFEIVEPTVYRRVAAQHEQGDKAWADAVAKHYSLDIVPEKK